MLRPRHAAQQLPPDPTGNSHRRRLLTPARLVVAAGALALLVSMVAGPAVSHGLIGGGIRGGDPARPAASGAHSWTASPAPAGMPVVQSVSGPHLVASSASAAPTLGPSPVPTSDPAVLTPELSAALTKQLATLRSKDGIPGIQAVIVFADGRSWRAHAGFQNYGARVPVQNATPFPVASVTKTFIAALVIQLVQEGRFGLDDLLVTYLPSSGVDARVTIRQLLVHTSGIADFFSNSRIDEAILACRTCVWTPSKSLSFVKKPLFAPGTKWSYSNTNYVLLGQLVEQVTGQSYASLLRTRFFEPLGLISTFVQGQEPAPYGVVHSYRFSTWSTRETPTALWDGTGIAPFRSLATAAGAAGDIASSARDLAVWARALYGGRVLGDEGSRAMLDFSGSLLLRSSIPYGLGAQMFTVAGRTAYGHSGRLMGARSAIRYLPTDGMSIAVVINTDRGDPAAIANALASLALPPLPVIVTPSPTPVVLPTPLPSVDPTASPF